MMMIRRLTALVGFALVGFAILGLFTGQGVGQFEVQPQPQPKGQPTPGGGNSSGLSSIKIIEDSNFRRVINVGRDCIKDKEYGQAVTALQAVLVEKKDHYVQIYERDSIGRDVPRWTSVKFEANNLIGSMPADGLEIYEAAFGADAKTKLDKAKQTSDRELLAEVAQQFCHTKAGIEANEILATLFLARGQVFTAALRFEKILQMNPERTMLSPLTLYKAAIAYKRSGDEKTANEIFERVKTKLNNQPLKIGDDLIPIAKLETVLKDGAIVDIVNIHDWPMIRGNLTNTAQANGSPPLLDTPLWSRPLFMDKLDGFPDEDPDQAAKQRVDTAIKQMEGMNQPVLPGFFPIASQGIMVYRNHRGLVAVALKELEMKDEESGQVSKIKPGQIVWKSIPMNRSLAMLLEKNEYRGKTEGWIDAYSQVPGFNSFLYDNTLLGSLSTDQRLVYGINDLAVPPHPAMFTQFAFNNPAWNPQNLKPLVMQNELFAYDLVTGKLKWDLNADDPQFKDSHFLSMPISVGGKLYVLNERLLNPTQGGVGNPFGGQPNPIGGESELRIVCIDPTKLVQVNSNTKPTIMEPIQVLGNVEIYDRFVQDIGRRVNAVHLAYGEGVLVCPTNAGEIFGIDLMTRSLVWSYPYRESEHQQIVLPGMPNVNPRLGKIQNQQGTTVILKWRSTPPAIQDGKIVFTAPDADSLHCVSLRDGKPLWKRKQEDGDQFMAGVYNGRVLIVGKTMIRALDLRTGSQVWAVSTGDMPSGQGVASKGVYYQPLKRGEILAVEIERGHIKAHNRSAVAGAAPGNLIFYEDMVLSQTTHEVMAYPQLSKLLEFAKRDSTKDPENMVKLTDYGELLLKDGQVNLAVDSLLKVYHNKPAEGLGKRVKERLFEALTDLMQVDFNTASKDHLTIYKALTVVPGNDAEEQNRKAKFFRLVGQGREAQGNLVEAFQMYKDFGALPMHHAQGGIPSTEDPNHKIPVNVWLRGRISGMLSKAPPAQKAPLEDKIAEEWKIVDAKKNVDEIRSFVGMFDVPFRVGREARVRLAESIMEGNEKANFLEAEMLLHQVMAGEFRADPKTGGPALAALALLEEKKGTLDSMRLAADYYRILDRDFTKVAVRGTKTGADLKNDLATDKRFLMFLEDSKNSWGPVKVAARDIPAGAFNVGLQGFVMQPSGDNTPFARQNRLMLDPSDAANPRIRFRDLANNQDRWATNLGHVPMNAQIFFNLYQQANVNQAYHPDARFRFYHVKGHLVVCQVGVMVYCLDGDTGKKLWEIQTVDNIQNNGVIHMQQVMNDSEGNPEFLFWNQLTNQRFKVALGRIGAAHASYVAVVGQKGLTVVDPLRGSTLWKKHDVSMNSHVFGDEQYLFVADANDGGAVGVGRTLRAIDGEPMAVPDFSPAYQGRIRVIGRQILSASSGANYTLRLYDILSGKDTWSKNFPAGSFALKTEDSQFAGVVDPKGALTVLDVNTGKIVLESNVAQGRISVEDLKGLRDPVLLHDGERFYVALNKAIDGAKVGGGLLHNNFNNGTRCQIVNGWFLAIHRADGQKKLGDRDITWKKGDLAWHSDKPIANQLLIVEQFEQSPVVLFTSRYNEIQPNGGQRWVSLTQSLSKASGKWVYDSGPRQINGISPMFFAYLMDTKARTINLIGFSGTVQHYIDDGKQPAAPGGAMLNPGTGPGGIAVQPVPQPQIGIAPRPPVLIRPQPRILPLIEPPNPKKD